MNWSEIILAIVTALLSAGNIAQFAQLRQLRRKGSAEAYQTEIQALRTIIEGNVAEIKRLQTEYGELQQKYFDLAEELQKIKAIHKKKTSKTK